MQPLHVYFTIGPIVFYFLVGASGPWRRVLVWTLVTLAALIAATQYSGLVGAFIKSNLSSPERYTDAEFSALGFLGVFAAVFVLLGLLYVIAWRPEPIYESEVGCFVRLVRGALLIPVAWYAGVMVAVAFITITGRGSSDLYGADPAYQEMFLNSLEFSKQWLMPWSYGDSPEFLREWWVI